MLILAGVQERRARGRMFHGGARSVCPCPGPLAAQGEPSRFLSSPATGRRSPSHTVDAGQRRCGQQEAGAKVAMHGGCACLTSMLVAVVRTGGEGEAEAGAGAAEGAGAAAPGGPQCYRRKRWRPCRH